MLLLNTFVFCKRKASCCALLMVGNLKTVFFLLFIQTTLVLLTHVCSFINFAASKFTEFIYISYWELHGITFDLKPEKGAKPKSTNSESETEAVHSSRIQHCDINFSFTASLTEWFKIFLLSL